MNRTEYVAGFLFRKNGTEVALVQKNKPAWQAGKLNGIGGKIEAGEKAIDAMVREFEEETGARVTHWRKFCTLYCPQARVYFFESRVGDSFELKTVAGEKILWRRVWDLLHPAMTTDNPIFNLRWLIPMALDKDSISGVVHCRD